MNRLSKAPRWLWLPSYITPSTFKWAKCLTSDMFSEAPHGQIKKVMIFAYDLIWIYMAWLLRPLKLEVSDQNIVALIFLTLSFNALGIYLILRKAVAWKCSVKRVFLNIWQDSKENYCAGVSFSTKLQAD